MRTVQVTSFAALFSPSSGAEASRGTSPARQAHAATASSQSPDETEGRMICRNRDGALECWNSPRTFAYTSFDDACESARSAIEKAGKLP